ncbi:MAG: hypothetical protein V3R74_02375 [Alphaproteobacteria bacterium]
MTRRLKAAAAAAALALVLAPGAATAERVRVTGEIIDSWCYLTEIMYALGSAHHQCATWCAAGGVPVGILDDAGQVYIVLKMGAGGGNVADPAMLEIQSHRVTVEADLIERDGAKYLLIDSVVDDQGVVNLTHEDYGIQPFGE